MRLYDILATTTWASDRWSANGHLFIRKHQIDTVNCHELYRGGTAREITAIAKSYDGVLSPAHRAFLVEQNGARLFDNGIAIFGSRPPIRNPGSLADAGPIRCEDEAYRFRLLHADLWDLGFRPNGGIETTADQTLLMSKDDELWLIAGDAVQRLGPAEAFVEPLIRAWDECLSSGLNDDQTFAVIERWLVARRR